IPRGGVLSRGILEVTPIARGVDYFRARRGQVPYELEVAGVRMHEVVEYIDAPHPLREDTQSLVVRVIVRQPREERILPYRYRRQQERALAILARMLRAPAVLRARAGYEFPHKLCVCFPRQESRTLDIGAVSVNAPERQPAFECGRANRARAILC